MSSPKGISAGKLWEILDVTYKVAWHLGHRIRATIAEGALVLGSLRGVVELGEVYAGAPPRSQSWPAEAPSPVSNARVGRGTTRPLVLTIVERGGPAIMKGIGTHSGPTIKDAAWPRLDPTATLATDGLAAYGQVAAAAGPPAPRGDPVHGRARGQ